MQLLPEKWFEKTQREGRIMDLEIVPRDRDRDRDRDSETQAPPDESLTVLQLRAKIDDLQKYLNTMSLPDRGQKLRNRIHILQSLLQSKSKTGEQRMSTDFKKFSMFGNPEQALQSRDVDTCGVDEGKPAFDVEIGHLKSKNQSVYTSPLISSNRSNSLTSIERPAESNIPECSRTSSSGCHDFMFRKENITVRSTRKRTGDSSCTKQSPAKKKLGSHSECSARAKVILLEDEDDEKPIERPNRQVITRSSKRKDFCIYYPERNHPESVEIYHSDMDCLNPCTYLSSPIINFYIQYLQQEVLSIEQKSDYHFFNTFFYNKLEEAYSSQNQGGKAGAFIKLRRWLKGINIFKKTYLFMPIHASQHWSLAIISNPAKDDESGPLILHLDSLGIHCSIIIFECIRSYLLAEWEHASENLSDIPFSEKIWTCLGDNIHEKKIEVPQQNNEYDCGIFVLLFMEHFIRTAPPRLKKDNLQQFGRKWFQSSEASTLRNSIKRLLKKLFCKGPQIIQNNIDESPVILEEVD